MPKKIADIKYEFEHAAMEDWNPLFDLYKEDGRSGVAKLIAAYQKRQKAYEDECQRLILMEMILLVSVGLMRQAGVPWLVQ